MSRILVIDDDGLVRQYVGDLLRNQGHEIEEASDGEIGLRKAEAGRFDLLITDIVMPGKEGLEIVTHLRKQKQDIKIIVMTASYADSSFDVLKVAKFLGADATIRKPIEADVLHKAVDSLIGQPSDLARDC